MANNKLFHGKDTTAGYGSGFFTRISLHPGLTFHGAYRRRPAALAAAAAAGQPQQGLSTGTDPETKQQVDHGLESFKALIGERRFTCTQCGKCCTGEGEVWITDEEAKRIAAYLGLPLQRFNQQYARAYSKVEGFKLLRAQNNPTRDCIFLQPDNTCSIHKVRPLQCSTYPWWPDLMNRQDWDWEKSNICEGFDHPDAPPTDMADAARQLRASTAMEYQRMLSRKPSKKQQRARHVTAGGSSSNSSSSHTASPHAAVQLPAAELDCSASGAAFHHVSSGPQQQQQALEARQPAGDPSAKGKVAAHDGWQQRLARLQELSQLDDPNGS